MVAGQTPFDANSPVEMFQGHLNQPAPLPRELDTKIRIPPSLELLLLKLLSKDPKVRKATDSRFSNPMNFDQLARLFPKVTFVLAHMGYPFFTEAMSVAHANENVYLDISGSGP